MGTVVGFPSLGSWPEHMIKIDTIAERTDCPEYPTVKGRRTLDYEVRIQDWGPQTPAIFGP